MGFDKVSLTVLEEDLKLLTMDVSVIIHPDDQPGRAFNAHVIVSLEESWGYYAFVIVMPPPQRFLVCALQPAVLIQPFSNLGHMSLVPRSRHLSILGTLRFHLWPLGGQK